MPYLVECLSTIPQYRPLIHWLSEPVGWTFPYASGGVPLEAKNVPTEARVALNHRTLPDFLPFSPAIGVWPVFREIVEELEPGVHQFFPTTLYARSGEKAHRQYDLFNIVGKVDAVIEAKSDVERLMNDSGNMVLHFSHGKPHLTLDAKLIYGRHVWRGNNDLRSRIFFSDELGDRVEKLKLKKLDLLRTEQV